MPGLLPRLLLLAAVSVPSAGLWAKRFEFDTYEHRPAAWFATDEARAIADNILLFQHADGGWPKNRDMTLTPAQEEASRRIPDDERRPTFDNGATHSQLQFLARVIAAGAGEERHRAAFLRGLDYTLAAQYPNGGWPQYFPVIPGYYAHITFNDEAMVGVLAVLHGVASGAPPFAFVDGPRRARSAAAVERGISCILRCQIIQDGRRTIWGAQHDEVTLAPAPARKFEPASLSAGESVGILRFLMGIEEPSAEVVAAVEGGIVWLRAHAVSGLRWEFFDAPDRPGGKDRRTVPDPEAPPLWARFHELETNRPIFIGRDGIIRYAVDEIEHERRMGYAWYVRSPERLLERDYPRWKQRINAFTVANAERKERPRFPQLRRPAVSLGGDCVARESLQYARAGGVDLHLDLYRPADERMRPAVLIVHGGGWETGSREMERPLAMRLAQLGWVAVPVSYRLGPAGRFPHALHDLKTAVAWLREHADAHGIDPARIAIAGGSAGGQLAALVGATNGLETLAAPGIAPERCLVQAVVNIDGLADFTDADLVASQEMAPSSPVRFLGGKFSEVPEAWRAASPLTHAGPHSAPALFLASTAPLPLLPGREVMRDRLLAAGVASELVFLPDTPHPFWLFEPWFGEVVRLTDDFLRRTLGSP